MNRKKVYIPKYRLWLSQNGGVVDDLELIVFTVYLKFSMMNLYLG